MTLPRRLLAARLFTGEWHDRWIPPPPAISRGSMDSVSPPPCPPVTAPASADPPCASVRAKADGSDAARALIEKYNVGDGDDG